MYNDLNQNGIDNVGKYVDDFSEGLTSWLIIQERHGTAKIAYVHIYDTVIFTRLSNKIKITSTYSQNTLIKKSNMDKNMRSSNFNTLDICCSKVFS